MGLQHTLLLICIVAQFAEFELLGMRLLLNQLHLSFLLFLFNLHIEATHHCVFSFLPAHRIHHHSLVISSIGVFHVFQIILFVYLGLVGVVVRTIILKCRVFLFIVYLKLIHLCEVLLAFYFIVGQLLTLKCRKDLVVVFLCIHLFLPDPVLLFQLS